MGGSRRSVAPDAAPHRGGSTGAPLPVRRPPRVPCPGGSGRPRDPEPHRGSSDRPSRRSRGSRPDGRRFLGSVPLPAWPKRRVRREPNAATVLLPSGAADPVVDPKSKGLLIFIVGSSHGELLRRFRPTCRSRRPGPQRGPPGTNNRRRPPRFSRSSLSRRACARSSGIILYD